MGRRGRAEIGFGSDSFLDIIANIVGILIILIVVAGLRVSNAPVPTDAPPEVEETVVTAEIPQPKPTPQPAPPTPEPKIALPQLPIPPLPESTQPVLQPQPQQPTPADEGLLAAIDRLEREIALLEQTTAAANERVVAMQSGRTALQRSMRFASAQVKSDRSNAAILEAKLAKLKLELQNDRNQLAGLRLQYDEAQRRPSKTKVIRHKLMPVSRLVKGQEIHFRLFAGKIAHVPIDLLSKRMRKDVVEQKDWLIKFRRHQGEVGPLRGFSMKYVVERQETSAIDQLRNGGYGQISIVLSEWRIVPSPDLDAETADDALQIGSAFIRELRATDPATTLTFWVYPDSFPLFRKLQKFAHGEGFTVAARPLPFGVPIAGSPRGTRSAGQ